MLRSRAAALALGVLPFFLALYAVTLHASIGRPLWIDEFTHFAFAAEPTTRDAWALFLSTADYIQHGQTGIYIILNYLTLSNLGPDATLLRLPSILSGLFLFGSAIALFRVLGFSVLWQVVVVAALTGQHLLMYYVGEARAYAPIPAAATGLLLYYVARPVHPGSRALLCFGIAAAVLGSTMHAYFAVYWPVVCLVAYVHHTATTGDRAGLRSLIVFANPGLVALGAGAYLFLAALTWLRGHQGFNLDPFEWLHQLGPVVNFTDYSHTQFLCDNYAKAAVLTGVAMLGGVLLPPVLRGRVRAFRAPLLLILLSILVSLLIGWMSYRSEYWILPRQWVGSVALVAIGTVWLWAEGTRAWARLAPPLGIAIGVVALLVVAEQATKNHAARLADLNAYLHAPRVSHGSETCEQPTGLDFRRMSNDRRNDVMVELANRNLACGGPIWPIFRTYYSEVPAG